MNPVMKRKVYWKGTVKQWKFIAKLSEMTKDELDMLLMFHDHKDDQFVQDELGLNRKAFDLLEESMCTKVYMGILMCVNFSRDNMDLD